MLNDVPEPEPPVVPAVPLKVPELVVDVVFPELPPVVPFAPMN